MLESDKSSPENTTSHLTISMDGYSGNARDVCAINQEAARLLLSPVFADMRYPIFLYRRGPYKKFAVSKIESSRPEGGRGILFQNPFSLIETSFAGDCWQVGVSEDKLPNTSEQEFVRGFRGAVMAGYVSSLCKEKLFNAGKLNVISGSGFYFFSFQAARFISDSIALSQNMVPYKGEEFLLLALQFVNQQLVNNVFNLGLLGILDHGRRKLTEKLDLDEQALPLGSNWPSFQDPFMRQRIEELFLPTVPIDRLTLGLIGAAVLRQKLVLAKEQPTQSTWN